MLDMKNLLDRFLQAVLSLFPLSPFREMIDELGSLPYLGYINWFVPIGLAGGHRGILRMEHYCPLDQADIVR